jgi:TonB family protein
MCRLVGVSPPFYFSSEIGSPVAFGFWKPLILVPDSFREMPLDFQKAISCHELWHVRRNDWLFGLLEEVAVAIFWFHPAMWWVTSRIQLSREQVIDRLVLNTTGERKPYLDALLQMALVRGQTELTLAPLFLTKHHLTQRVALILTEVAMSRTRIAIAVAVLFVLLSLTGRFAMRAFPLEAPTSPTGQVDASLQAKRSTAATLRAPSRTIPPEELSLIHQTRPTYPVEAKIQRIQGEVLLAVNVNEKGEVDNIEVLKGPAPLVLSALDAVKQWRYAPYLKDGVAVPVNSTVTVNFALAGTKPAGEQVQRAGMVRTDERVILRTPPLAYRVEPVYPLEAKEKGIEGEVRFALTVDEHGDVTDVRVLRGNAMLVSAAYEAVRQWKYTPVFMDGVPIRVYVSVAIKFELNPKSAADSKPAAEIPAAAINAQAEWRRQRPSEEELQRRVEYANMRFAPDGVSGSTTDRGRVYIEWGPPDQIESHPNGGPVSEPVALRISWVDRDENDPFEIWTYRRIEQAKAVADLLVGFFGKDYRLASPKGPLK